KLEIAGNDVEPVEIGLADHLRERHALLVVADRAVKRVVAGEIELRLIAEQRRHGRLRVKVNRQRAVALKREILRQMRGRGRFAGTALEIGDGDHLQVLSGDRKSTRLNSSHVKNSYAVFCLKKKNIQKML